jgi:uncharacterized phage protein (TIGR02218 family)
VQLAGAALLSGQTVVRRANDGYFDDARVQIDHLVGNDPAHAISLGPVKAWWEGKVAGVDPAPDVVRLGLASDLEMLGITQLPKFLYGPACMHAVYDANCTLNKATFTLTGTASGVPTTTTVPTASVALTAKAAGYFNLGVLVFTSGALTGVRRAVRDWSSNTFTLYLPLPSAPAAGDAISVYPGCARTKLDCGPTGSGGKFNNLVNFRGFVNVPIGEGANNGEPVRSGRQIREAIHTSRRSDLRAAMGRAAQVRGTEVVAARCRRPFRAPSPRRATRSRFPTGRCASGCRCSNAIRTASDRRRTCGWRITPTTSATS